MRALGGKRMCRGVSVFVTLKNDSGRGLRRVRWAGGAWSRVARGFGGWFRTRSSGREGELDEPRATEICSRGAGRRFGILGSERPDKE